MENLRAWLNGCRDYTAGVLLYNQYGSDVALKRMFAEAESSFKKKRLSTALEQLWDQRGAPAKILHTAETIPTSKLEKIIEEKNEEIEDLQSEKEDLEDVNEDLEDELRDLKCKRNKSGWPVDMDDTLNALHAQWKPLFLQMVDLQSRLYEVAKAGVKNKAKEKEAGKMALQILDLRDKTIGIYEQRDHYLQHGQLPLALDPVEECLDPVLYKLRYDNAMKYARDYRNKLAKLSPEDQKYLKLQQQLQKWEGEAAKYRKLLKQD